MKPALAAVSTRFVLAVVCLLCALAAVSAADGGPAEQLTGAINRILEDPALKGEVRAADRHRAVRQIADEIFDFEETARRAMAQHWRSLTPAQRREFVDAFSDLLERAYMSKIELYSGEKIQYPGERVEGDVASVATRIITKKGTEVPIDLVANYRTQFNRPVRVGGRQRPEEQRRAIEPAIVRVPRRREVSRSVESLERSRIERLPVDAEPVGPLQELPDALARGGGGRLRHRRHDRAAKSTAAAAATRRRSAHPEIDSAARLTGRRSERGRQRR